MKSLFFCEACGAEVPGETDTCPSCGRSFQGVRCSRCKRAGQIADFAHGCPDCGYLSKEKIAEVVMPTGLDTAAKKLRRQKDWPTSRYWMLSVLIIIVLSLVIYIWISG